MFLHLDSGHLDSGLIKVANDQSGLSLCGTQIFEFLIIPRCLNIMSVYIR